MSSAAAIDFLNKVEEDNQLYEHMHQVVGDFNQVQLAGSVGQEVVKIGQDNGYDFSVEEISSAFNDIREQHNNALAELSEAQLDEVAGGNSSGSLALTYQTFGIPHSILFGPRASASAKYKPYFHP